MASVNCKGNFWFSLNNDTVLIGKTNNLGSAFFGVLSNIFNIFFCLFGHCPTTSTTPAPIIYAITVCTRSIQNNIRQKCSLETQQTIQADIQTFSFRKSNIYAGILSTITVQSQIGCHGICSLNDICVGTTFDNGICTLY